jgi:hypothetical protein
LNSTVLIKPEANNGRRSTHSFIEKLPDRSFTALTGIFLVDLSLLRVDDDTGEGVTGFSKRTVLDDVYTWQSTLSTGLSMLLGTSLGWISLLLSFSLSEKVDVPISLDNERNRS